MAQSKPKRAAASKKKRITLAQIKQRAAASKNTPLVEEIELAGLGVIEVRGIDAGEYEECVDFANDGELLPGKSRGAKLGAMMGVIGMVDPVVPEDQREEMAEVLLGLPPQNLMALVDTVSDLSRGDAPSLRERQKQFRDESTAGSETGIVVEDSEGVREVAVGDREPVAS